MAVAVAGAVTVAGTVSVAESVSVSVSVAVAVWDRACDTDPSSHPTLPTTTTPQKNAGISQNIWFW